jgi:hypothetical protein
MKNWLRSAAWCGGLILALLALSPGSAQAQNTYTTVDLTGLLGAAGTHAVMAVAPASGVPAVAWREAGAQFGTDAIGVAVWDGSAFVQIDASALSGGQISAAGLGLTISADNTLYLAVNQAYEAMGVGEFRTQVWALTNAGWAALGDPLGMGESAGPLYLLDTDDGLSLIFREIADDGIAVRALLWDGSAWASMGADALNINIGTEALTLEAAVVGGRPVIAWTEAFPGDSEVQLTIAAWDGGGWQGLASLPNQSEIEIGTASLAGIAAGDDSLYIATTESSGSANFVLVWGYNGSAWDHLSLPVAAEESECAQNHAIAVDPAGTPFYAWTADCTGRLPLTVWTGDTWLPLDSDPIAVNDAATMPVDLNIAPDGTIYVMWLEATGGLNAAVSLVQLLPG